MNITESASFFVESLGGKDNLVSIENCMTRVRLIVKDPSKCDIEAIKKYEDVLGVIAEGEAIQIVVGPGKSTKIATEMSNITGVKSIEVDEASRWSTARTKAIRLVQSMPPALLPEAVPPW